MSKFIQIFMVLSVFAFFIFLQLYICKKIKIKKISLILPVGSFILSLFPILTIIILMILGIIFNITSISDIFNNIYVIVFQIINTIILIGILILPSIIFMLIYLYYKKKEDKINPQ